MNKYLYFFLKLVVLTIILAVLDFAIGSTLRYYYFKQNNGKQYRTTVSMEQTTADIIAFGSSRANHHYHPRYFEEKLNQTFYNAGRDGEYIFYHYAVLKAILKRHRPKLVILELQRKEFSEGEASYDKIASLLPYYDRHPEIRPIVYLKGEYERIKLLSGIYPFNSSALSIVAGNRMSVKARENELNGYVPLTSVWTRPLEKEKVNVQRILDIDSTKVSIYKSFIADCKKANVDVIVVCSPYFVRYENADESIELAKKIAQYSGVKFYDFSNDPYFLSHRELFSDLLHLNDNGAIIFTQKLLAKMTDDLSVNQK